MNFSSRKDRDAKTSIHLPGSVGVGWSDSDVAVVCIKVYGGVAACGGGAVRKFRGPDLRLCCLVIEARSIGTLQVNLNGQGRQRLVGGFLGQNKLLTGRQSDDSSQQKFLSREVVACGDELLLAGLQLDLRTQRIDCWTQASLLLVIRFVVQGLGVLNLGAGGFDAGGGGDRLQVGVADSKHYKFSGILIAVLRGFQAFGGGTFFFQISEAERLDDRSARIEVVEGTNDARDREWKYVALKAEGREALGLYIFQNPGGEVGQEAAEFFPSLAPRHDGLVTGEKEAEIVAQPALDGLLETQLQDFRSGFALGLAAGEGALRSRKRDGRRGRGLRHNG